VNRWKDWAAFWLLGLIWGSSFLWIRIAVQEIGPFMLVALRVLIGALGLAVVALVVRPACRARRELFGHGCSASSMALPVLIRGETRTPPRPRSSTARCRCSPSIAHPCCTTTACAAARAGLGGLHRVVILLSKDRARRDRACSGKRRYRPPLRRARCSPARGTTPPVANALAAGRRCLHVMAPQV
jgi:hypothetical protein